MSRITTTVAIFLLATAAYGQAKEDVGDGKQLNKQTMELRQFGIRKCPKKLVISLLFCNFIVVNQ